MDREQFLKYIGTIESNMGKNTDHPEIKTGRQAGTKAIGTYALMPRTVQEMANRFDISELKGKSEDQISYILKNDPMLAKQVAENMADYILTKPGITPQKAAFMWLNGHNLTPDNISDERLSASDYVNKFNRLSGNESIIDKAKILQALNSKSSSSFSGISSMSGLGSMSPSHHPLVDQGDTEHILNSLAKASPTSSDESNKYTPEEWAAIEGWKQGDTLFNEKAPKRTFASLKKVKLVS